MKKIAEKMLLSQLRNKRLYKSLPPKSSQQGRFSDHFSTSQSLGRKEEEEEDEDEDEWEEGRTELTDKERGMLVEEGGTVFEDFDAGTPSSARYLRHRESGALGSEERVQLPSDLSSLSTDTLKSLPSSVRNDIVISGFDSFFVIVSFSVVIFFFCGSAHAVRSSEERRSAEVQPLR